MILKKSFKFCFSKIVEKLVFAFCVLVFFVICVSVTAVSPVASPET